MNQNPYPTHDLAAIPRRSNGLGVAGFVVSLLGLLGTCGLLSPIGLVMSAFAMRREPRGLAIAGLIIGIVGSLWLIIAFAVFGLWVLAIVAIAVASGGHIMEIISATMEMNTVEQKIDAEYRQVGALPPSLDAVPALTQDEKTDPWGHPYHYTVDSSTGFTLASDGPDGIAGTSDDMTSQHTIGGGSVHRRRGSTTTSSPGSSPGSP